MMPRAQVPTDATACTVVAAKLQRLQAVRWYPPGHAQHGQEQADLLEAGTVEEAEVCAGGGVVFRTALSCETLTPGVWVVEKPAHENADDYDPAEFNAYDDADFRAAFVLADSGTPSGQEGGVQS